MYFGVLSYFYSTPVWPKCGLLLAGVVQAHGAQQHAALHQDGYLRAGSRAWSPCGSQQLTPLSSFALLVVLHHLLLAALAIQTAERP